MEKFLFNTHNFDNKRKDEEEKVTLSKEQLTHTQEQSFAQGREAGLQAAKDTLNQKTVEMLDNMSSKLMKISEQEDQRDIEMNMKALKLALRVIHKFLPQFSKDYALPEIENMILKSLETRRDEPRIAVTISTQHIDHLKPRIDALAVEKGFAGKVILVADDNMSASDCRVEWADGGAERLYERLSTQIENEFTKTLSGMENTLSETPSETHTVTENPTSALTEPKTTTESTQHTTKEG